MNTPDDATLDEVFMRARVARFSSHPPPRSGDAEVLLEVGGHELASLREVMRLAPGPGGHCMCMGDMALGFEDNRGETIATMTLHHGYTMRWDGDWEWADVAFNSTPALAGRPPHRCRCWTGNSTRSNTTAVFGQSHDRVWRERRRRGGRRVRQR